MKQIIINRDGRVVCQTSVPYPPEIIKKMKLEGEGGKNER